jgi:hypothetical protein
LGKRTHADKEGSPLIRLGEIFRLVIPSVRHGDKEVASGLRSPDYLVRVQNGLGRQGADGECFALLPTFGL